MAIAEAEPKKSEVAVTSAGVSDGMKEKVLNAGQKFADSKGYASSSTSSSVGTVKRYNLYDSIKGFRFEMPDGWNDEDIALFVTCCWEKKDDFVKSNGDRTKIWADIAQSGAKQSRNPSLFTINSCLALAERIRYYVSKNSSIFLDNEAFMKFHSDVKGLLPHFADNIDSNTVIESKCMRRKVKSKSVSEYSSELLMNDAGLGDVIHDLALENVEAIRSGNRNVWTEMANKLEEHLGVNTDVKAILESEKNKIISSVARMEEKGIDKKTAFIECARGFVEVFDYINPKKVKVSDYLEPSVGSTVGAVTQGRDKSTAKVGRLNQSSEIDVGEEVAKQEEKRVKRGRGAPRGRRPKNRTIESKVDERGDGNPGAVVEPWNTTSLGEPADSQLSKEKKRKNSVSNEDVEKVVISKATTKSSRRRKVSPLRRVMPPRIARSKVTTYSLKTRRNSGGGKGVGNRRDSTSKLNRRWSDSKEDDSDLTRSNPNFKGIEDTDSEEATIDFTERFKRTRGVKNASGATTKVANPDTTTKDPDDKTTEGDVPFVKKINRKRVINRKQDLSSKQEDSGSKVRVVNADCTMKNLVVKLVDCNGSIDYPSHANIIKQDKGGPFNGRIRHDRSKEVRLIEESAVLAKDVVDSEYNPSSDSAKLVSDEHLNNGHFSGLRNEPASMSMPATSLMGSSHSTKHHIPPFFEFAKHMSGGTRVSADSSEDVGPVKATPFSNWKLQDDSVSSPYSADQTPSTSSAVNSTTAEPSLESALATLKKCRKEMINQNSGSVSCVTFNEVFENSQFLSKMQDAPLPDWFNSFVSDFRNYEAWKIEKLFKLQQELTDVEHRKIMLLENILGSMVKK